MIRQTHEVIKKQGSCDLQTSLKLSVPKGFRLIYILSQNYSRMTYSNGHKLTGAGSQKNKIRHGLTRIAF